jgi:hypothetical protein
MSYRPSFREFTIRRMGNPTGPLDGLLKMISLSFGAKSFADFWRYWNPAYHYVLLYWIYQPLRKLVPRPIAVLISFMFCGLIFHDIFLLPFTHMPLITAWFLFLGIGVIIGEQLHMDLSRIPKSLRIIINILYIVGLFELTRRIMLKLYSI